MFAKARAMHKEEMELYGGHWNTVKVKLANGTARPCFSTDMIAMQKADPESVSDPIAAYLAGSFLEAGSDTTSSTLYAFVQAMLVFPEVQKKAQAEIDALIGGGGDSRLPNTEDEGKLPYIRACIKETCRWMPTTVLGAAPHACTKEGGDEYMGYHIPKGAIVVNNVYTLNMDEKRFPHPRQFRPERYVEAGDNQSLFDSAVNPDVSKRDQYTFGAGRHLCQGMHLAERSLFLGMARILWAFDVVPQLDSAGNPIIPNIEDLTQGLVILPQPFKVQFKPRSEKRRLMVEQEWAEAEEQLDPVTKQWKHIPEGMKFKKDGLMFSE